jgi:Flp pilus assembly protein TadG
MNRQKATTSVSRRTSWRNRHSRGQSMVEFALMAPLALVIMLVGIQYAIIGQASLAVSQGSAALARYAAANSNTAALGTYNGTGALPASAQAIMPDSICPGGTCPAGLTVKVASYQGTTATTTNTPKAQVDRLEVTVNYDATKKIVLPTTWFFGIKFPTALASTDSQMYE